MVVLSTKLLPPVNRTIQFTEFDIADSLNKLFLFRQSIKFSLLQQNLKEHGYVDNEYCVLTDYVLIIACYTTTVGDVTP